MMEKQWQTLQEELENHATSEQRRLQIGELLDEMNDLRPVCRRER